MTLKTAISQSRLKELLDYSELEGTFRWRVNRGGMANAGAIAGYINREGYRNIHVDGRCYCAHRLAFLFMVGSMPTGEVDHINHVRDDNRWTNLRECSRRENAINASLSCRNTSGVTGVYWHKPLEKWYAQIVVNGVLTHLGCFDSINEAASCRKKAQEEGGFHKNHGT